MEQIEQMKARLETISRQTTEYASWLESPVTRAIIEEIINRKHQCIQSCIDLLYEVGPVAREKALMASAQAKAFENMECYLVSGILGDFRNEESKLKNLIGEMNEQTV